MNFTTLGYGDILPVARWELLGPLTAMNGILLLGWSTAAIFAVLASQLREMAVHPPAHSGPAITIVLDRHQGGSAEDTPR